MRNRITFILLVFALWSIAGCQASPAPTISPTLTFTPIATITATLQPPTPTEVFTETPTGPTPIPGFDELRLTFEYDKTDPLGVHWGSQSQEGEAIIHDVTYMGADKCKVYAIWVTPTGQGPYPAIIYIHKGLSDKYQYLDEAILLAKHEVASLLLDSPFNSGCGDSRNPRKGYIRTVIAARRGVDLLESLPEVDATRLGYVGHSYGATWGGVLVGVESRIKAYVLIAGTAKISELDSPEVPDLDAIHYIPYAEDASFLFQFASQDQYISEIVAKQYFEVAPGYKEVFWYNTTHSGLQENAQEDRLSWLARQLGFKYP